MDVAAFDFELPAHLIAQAPPAERGASKLLVMERGTGRTQHADVGRLPEFLRGGDLLVVKQKLFCG